MANSGEGVDGGHEGVPGSYEGGPRSLEGVPGSLEGGRGGSAEASRDLRSHSPVLFALGDWRIRVTALLRRERRRLFQQCLVLPPPGFSGEARISVIDGQRREEFSARWQNGQDPSVPAAVRPHLARLTARLFASAAAGGGSASDTAGGAGANDAASAPPPVAQHQTIAETPAVIGVPVGDARGREPVQVNFLFEPQPFESPNGTHRDQLAFDLLESPSETLSGGMIFPRAAAGASVYLMPILVRPANGDPPRTLLLDALRALERHSTLRLAVVHSLLTSGQKNSLLSKLYAAAGTGRLEIVLGSFESRDDVQVANTDEPPLPAQTAIVHADEVEERVEPIARQGARRLLVVAESPDQAPALAARRELGLTVRMQSASGDVLAHLALNVLRDDPFVSSAAPYAVALLHQHLIESIRIAVAVPAGAPKTRWLAACPLFLQDARGLSELDRRVTRWNRQHLSPRIVMATPADFFSTVEALENRGFIRPRPIK